VSVEEINRVLEDLEYTTTGEEAVYVEREAVDTLEDVLKDVCREVVIEETKPSDIFVEDGWATDVYFTCDGKAYVVTIMFEEETRYHVSFSGAEELERRS